MPVYNAGKYLSEAIESILAQDFTDFELIAINDGSTDSSAHILEHYQKRDKRVRVYHQVNLGRVAAANKALQLAKGKYAARMDSDDISLNHRLFRQVEFMENHPDIGASGTWLRCFGERNMVMRSPTDPETTRSLLLFESTIYNSTAIMRTQCLLDSNLFYRNLNEQGMAEDYDLWSRLSTKTKLTNIPEVLFLYRTHSEQSVCTHISIKRKTASRIRVELLNRLGLEPTCDEAEIHQALSYLEIQSSKNYIERIEDWLIKLTSANIQARLYDGNVLSQVLFDRWLKTCYMASDLGVWTWKKYRDSQITQEAIKPISSEARLALKCALRWSRK